GHVDGAPRPIALRGEDGAPPVRARRLASHPLQALRRAARAGLGDGRQARQRLRPAARVGRPVVGGRVTAVSSLFVSVVCRLRDERALVESLLEDLTRVLRANYENWEIVLVDDGSRRGTTARVKALLGRYEGGRLLRLSRGLRRAAGVTARLEPASGGVG